MRALIWLLLVSFASTDALAQRGGVFTGPVGAPAPGVFRGGAGLPALSPIPTVQPIPAFGMGAPRVGGSGAIFRGTGGFPGVPFYPVAGGYAAYPQVQNLILLQAPPRPSAAPAPVPPKPAQLMIWEAEELEPPARLVLDEQPSFSIALKDGTTVSAAAVWVQDDLLHYVDTEGAHKRVGLDAIERDITRRLNRARNLELRLPPPR